MITQRESSVSLNYSTYGNSFELGDQTNGWEEHILHGDLSETVYMKQPADFVDREKPHHVCKINKAIYGHKQAPRAWFGKFSYFLIDFGFVCSKSDPSMFVYTINKNMTSYYSMLTTW